MEAVAGYKTLRNNCPAWQELFGLQQTSKSFADVVFRNELGDGDVYVRGIVLRERSALLTELTDAKYDKEKTAPFNNSDPIYITIEGAKLGVIRKVVNFFYGADCVFGSEEEREEIVDVLGMLGVHIDGENFHVEPLEPFWRGITELAHVVGLPPPEPPVVRRRRGRPRKQGNVLHAVPVTDKPKNLRRSTRKRKLATERGEKGYTKGSVDLTHKPKRQKNSTKSVVALPRPKDILISVEKLTDSRVSALQQQIRKRVRDPAEKIPKTLTLNTAGQPLTPPDTPIVEELPLTISMLTGSSMLLSRVAQQLCARALEYNKIKGDQ